MLVFPKLFRKRGFVVSGCLLTGQKSRRIWSQSFSDLLFKSQHLIRKCWSPQKEEEGETLERGKQPERGCSPWFHHVTETHVLLCGLFWEDIRASQRMAVQCAWGMERLCPPRKTLGMAQKLCEWPRNLVNGPETLWMAQKPYEWLMQVLLGLGQWGHLTTWASRILGHKRIPSNITSNSPHSSGIGF